MQCIIEGCQNEGKHNLGIRLRRPNTSSIWAPNTDAFVCDFHASRGLRVTVLLEPTDDGKLETVVRSIGQAAYRVTRITQIPADSK